MNNGERYDPEFEKAFQDRKLKQAFRNVGKDVGRVRHDFKDFKEFVTQEFGKLLIAEEKVSELLKLNKDLADLQKKIDSVSGHLKEFAPEKKIRAELDRISKNISETVSQKQYNEKIKQIDEILAAKHVKKIDIAQVEAQINNLRKELESLHSAEKDIKALKEDFISFRKQALTRYNFDKLEKWIKEIETDVLDLVSLKKKVDMLSSVKEVEDMRRSFNRNAEEFVRMRKSFDRLLALQDDFKKSEKESKEQFTETSKRFKGFDSDLSSLENDFDRLERRISRLEKKSSKAGAGKPAKPGTKKGKKKSKKPGNIFRRAVDWLLEDTD